MKLRGRKADYSVLGLFVVALGQPVYAEEVAPDAKTSLPLTQEHKAERSADNASMLPEVTVSEDQHREVQSRTELGTLTKDTPLSGAVVRREELDNLQLVNNLLELGKRVPGLSMVRNMRIPDGGQQYTESRIDGMRSIMTNTSVFDEVDMNNIERIDIITGPGSALYGSGSLGGTISLYTRQPPEDLQAKLSQESGSWGFRRSQGYVGTSTANGRVGFILDGSSMDNDGWRHNNAAANQDSAAEHKQGRALKTLFRPTDTTKITLGVDTVHYDFRWAGPLAMTKFDQDWSQTVAGAYGQSIDDYLTQSLRLQQIVGERGELTVATAKHTDDGIGFGSGGSGGANNVICDNTTVICSSVNNGSGAVTNTLKKSLVTASTTTAIYRNEFDLAKSTLYLGMETSDITTDSATYTNAFSALQGQAGMWAQGAMASAGSVARERNYTPLVHFEFSPTDKLRFHVGERFDRITYSTDDRTAANRDIENTYSANVNKSGVTYDIDGSHVVWGNRADTFNAPAISTLLNSAATGTAGNTIGSQLDPQKGVTYELGFRGRFQDAGLHYDVALYNSSNTGTVVSRLCTAAEQTALNSGATCNINENAGGITARGLESMFTWAANSWLDVGATYVFAQAYFDRYKSTSTSASGNFDYSGNSYQAMPQTHLNLRVAVMPAPEWRVELEGDHISQYYVDNANSSTYSRPDLYNLRASYHRKNWSFWAQALNLTNREYATRVGYQTIAGQSVLAASAGQGNAGSYTPLTMRVGLAYNW